MILGIMETEMETIGIVGVIFGIYKAYTRLGV